MSEDTALALALVALFVGVPVLKLLFYMHFMRVSDRAKELAKRKAAGEDVDEEVSRFIFEGW